MKNSFFISLILPMCMFSLIGCNNEPEVLPDETEPVFYFGQCGGDMLGTGSETFNMLIAKDAVLIEEGGKFTMTGTGKVFQIIFLSSSAVNNQPDKTLYPVNFNMSHPSVVQGKRLQEELYFSVCFVLDNDKVVNTIPIDSGEMVIEDQKISCDFLLEDGTEEKFVVTKNILFQGL